MPEMIVPPSLREEKGVKPEEVPVKKRELLEKFDKLESALREVAEKPHYIRLPEIRGKLDNLVNYLKKAGLDTSEMEGIVETAGKQRFIESTKRIRGHMEKALDIVGEWRIILMEEPGNFVKASVISSKMGRGIVKMEIWPYIEKEVPEEYQRGVKMSIVKAGVENIRKKKGGWRAFVDGSVVGEYIKENVGAEKDRKWLEGMVNEEYPPGKVPLEQQLKYVDSVLEEYPEIAKRK